MFWNNDADILLQFLFLRRSLVRVQVKRPINWASFLVLAPKFLWTLSDLTKVNQVTPFGFEDVKLLRFFMLDWLRKRFHHNV